LFHEKNPQLDAETILVREFIDGIMVNLFYDKRVERWELSTRYKVGGDYYPQKNMDKKRTLTALFLDALCGDSRKPLDENPIIQNLHERFSYTFVLKVTEEETRPQIYLVAVFMILHLCTFETPLQGQVSSVKGVTECAFKMRNGVNHYVKYVSPIDYEKWRIFVNVNGVIQFPKMIENFGAYADLEAEMENIQHDYFRDGIGYMVTNHKTGEQTKYLYENYTADMERKRQQPNLEYQYFYFRRISRLTNNSCWIFEIPQNRKPLLKIHLSFEEFIRNVHTSYMDKYVYKKREGMLPKYEKYVNIIHKRYYLCSHGSGGGGGGKKKITRDLVRGFFDEMEPKELLYMMRL
jgi:hypothetical protein